MNPQISTLLAQLRAKNKLSKSEMARRLNVASQLYGRYESGEIQPKLPFIKKVNDVFKTSIGLNEQNDSNAVGVPLISSEAAAGFGTATFSITESDVQARYVVPDFPEIDFMIRVKGSSMYPKYSSGDVIACRVIRERKFIQWNKAYVVATREQGILCKRLRESDQPECLLAVSENPEYAPFHLPVDEITGMALVVGVIRLE